MDKIIKVGNRSIGGDSTFLIGDIGSNHNQDIQLAYDIIDAGVEAGLDAVKFQSLQRKHLYLNPTQEETDLYNKIDLEEDWHFKLKEHCDRRGIVFFSSPTYFRSVDLLEQAGVLIYKLASAQIGSFPQIVRRVASLRKPVILSTGLVSYSGLERVIKIFQEEGNDQFIILHCNSLYPPAYDRVNLGLISTYRRMFSNPVGFSDHTMENYATVAAVALGAKVIERHFCMDRAIVTPDSPVSLNPAEIKDMVKAVRSIEQALGNKPRTTIEPEEAGFLKSISYRLVLTRDFEKGHNFSRGDFEYWREKSGVDCRDEELVLNHFRAARSVKRGSILSWQDLEGKG
ncbi:MAG TPA: N-acetylneuraminate synthase family protein [Leptospiraceae bacterium]|nr:N-acetylneuraminate synthase family protein [Leptospirales bacterium]HMU84030.1 N-acetylneuraminate synthase family protein [Leptospiraceae bacterium]HMX58579.1 N-acetylneuraminate synthase family protein [Leptospiraceae bacterium]HNJ05397.1 N-acetylneuraminate synthase family protein [Leptospiraceae bacterium]HNN61099.1 N-acetylneuraminate synthase family protein [Leptospiraceae bacterium]